MYRIICQKPARSFVCPNGFGEHLFQMFIVLGMYNFGNVVVSVEKKVFRIDKKRYCSTYLDDFVGWNLQSHTKCAKIFFLSKRETFFGRNLKNDMSPFLSQDNLRKGFVYSFFIQSKDAT